MQQQQLIWLAGVLVLLVGIAFLAGAFDSEISTIDVPSLGIPTDALDTMEIVQDDSTTITINRTESGWQLTSPVQARTDSITMARFTENLGNLDFETVVSTNEERYATYGVAEGARRINLSWNDAQKSLILGNAGPDFQSIYIRLADDPRVFLTRGRLNLPADLDAWRDKVLIDVPIHLVNRIAVASPETSFEVEHDGSGWQITDTADDEIVPGDSASVASWVNRFSPIRAIGFLDETPAADIKAEASHQVHFTVPGGSTQTIWFLELEDDLAATVNNSNVTYRLSKSMLESYIPSIASLEADD